MQQSVDYISYSNTLAILLLAFNLLIVFRHHVGAIFVPKTPQEVLLPFRAPFLGNLGTRTLDFSTILPS